MTRLGWIAAAVALGLATPAAGGTDGPVWHTQNSPDSLQYGEPGSDLRALRIDCDSTRRLTIGGPSFVEAREGDPVRVRASGDLGSEVLEGEAVEAGDGMNFMLPVTARSLALRTLLAGKTLRLSAAGGWYDVPGVDAPPKLKPFLADCAAGRLKPDG